MSKKNKEQYEAEQEEQNKRAMEEQRIAQLKLDYSKYTERMQTRIDKGESIEIKSYENWIRKVKKTDKEGNLIEIEVSGESGETKNEKFRRLAVARMEKALAELDKIMNLSSNQYESSEQEQVKIVNALRLKVLDIENSFKVQEKEKEVFTL